MSRCEVVAEAVEVVGARADRPCTSSYEDADHPGRSTSPRAWSCTPGAGNHSDGTLVNALLHHDTRRWRTCRAPAVVHRIDKDTTGLLVVARTLSAHRTLVESLAQRGA